MELNKQLNLNNDPLATADCSFVFARNVMCDGNGIIPDGGASSINSVSDDYDIVGYIVGINNRIYLFTSDSKIIEYDEINGTSTEIKSGWHYGGGEIDGCVTSNISGEKILTICEYGNNNIPIKHINLSYCKETDNESLYTQAPEIPIVNMYQSDTYSRAIPYGTYIFFMRFRIRDGVYTSWHLVSAPMFIGTQVTTDALQGTFKYVNLHRDATESFVFNFSYFNKEAAKNYDKFQIGFIISHDDSNNARAWKEFDISQLDGGTIYFDYDEITEVDINDMLTNVYNINNVRNIAAFRNKLYISNYTESDIDIPNLKDYADIEIGVTQSGISGDTSEGIIKYKNEEIVRDSYGRYLNTKNGVQNLISLGFAKDDGGLIIKPLLKDDGSLDIETNSISIDNAITFYLTSYDMIDNENGVSLYLVDTIKHADGVKFDINDLNGTLTNNAVRIQLADYDSGVSDYVSLNTKDNIHPWKNIDIPYGFIILDKTLEELYKNTYNNYSEYSIGSEDLKLFELCNDNRPDGLNVTNLKDSDGYPAVKTGIYKIYDFITKQCYGSDAPSKNTFDLVDNKFSEAFSNLNNTQSVYCYATDEDGNIYKEKIASQYDDDKYLVTKAGSYNDISRIPFNSLSDNERKSRIDKAVRMFFEKDKTFLGVIINDDKSYSFCFKFGEKTINIKSLAVVTKTYTYRVVSDKQYQDNINRKYTVEVTVETNTVAVDLAVADDTFNISETTANEVNENTTLMPWSVYDIYCHLIDKHGIVTNGIKIKTINTSALDNDHSIYELTYKVNSIYNNKNYIGFFLSLTNCGNKICQLFDITKSTDSKVDSTEDVYYASCLEADTLLYALNNNIKIIMNDGTILTEHATYLSSGSTDPVVGFGNVGLIRFKIEENKDKFNIDNNPILFIVIDSKTNNDNPILHKCSGYIELTPTENQNVVPDGFFWSYMCYVAKPQKSYSDMYYVSGNEVTTLRKQSTTDSNPDADNSILMTNPEVCEINGKGYSGYDIYKENARIIHSNFNLNYLSLTTDLETKTFTEGEGSNKKRHLAAAANSAQLSFMFELKSMYKDFTDKTFSAYNKYAKTEFNNTVRMSNVLSDESVNNSVYTFYPTDYYNIPTDRGIIIKLFHISNSIYLHTEKALYKFDGNQTLETTDKDIKLKNADIFETGITQLLDSEYGYAGITNKKSGVITFDSYFFYDSISKHIFSYSGQGQFTTIDGTIYKFLRRFNADECYTIADVTNNRVFFDLVNTLNNTHVCLSYNYAIKQFISIHDLTLKKAFNSQIICYSYEKKFVSLFIGNLYDTDAYRCFQRSDIDGIAKQQLDNNDSKNEYQNTDLDCELSIIVFPISNQVESLESIQLWINEMQADLTPRVNKFNPLRNLIVTTDFCMSNVIDTTNKDSILDYKGFKYTKGFWTVNYFRNILNQDDVYDYTKDDKDAKARQRLNMLVSDQNSLMYGRYFIITFRSQYKFKLEAISINTNTYN